MRGRAVSDSASEHGWIVIGDVPFGIFDMRLSKYSIEFHIAAALTPGTVVPSPSRAVIRSPEGEIVYSYTYDHGPIAARGREWATLVQTINFIPQEGPQWADMSRVGRAAGRLPGSGRALGPGGPREIGR
jgi:hypothetical protein